MKNPDVKRKKCMRNLIDGLCKYPERYGSHRLVQPDFVKALIEDVRAPIPPELAISDTEGSLAFLKASGVLTLDVLNDELPRQERDEGLAIGFITLWFSRFQQAFFEDRVSWRYPTLGEVIEQCTDKEKLMVFMDNIPSVADWRSSDFDWIIDAFTRLHEQNHEDEKAGKRSPRGNRTAGNRRDAALLALLRHIERAAASLGFEIEDVLPELAEDSLEQIPLASIPDVIQDWNTRLAQCVADYRDFELSQIGKWLDKQQLPPFANWFQARWVCCPADQSEQEAHLISLEDICEQKQRVALLDHRGSGTTTALLWLSNQYCENTKTIEPVVLRLDAKKYIESRAGRPPCAFLASKVYGPGSESRERRKEFEDAINEAETVWLIDNLARLSPENQTLVMRDIRFSGLIFTTTIGASGVFLSGIGGGNVKRLELAPLQRAQIELFIQQFSDRCGSEFNTALARHVALRELLETGQLPLGLEAICEQVLALRGDCASGVERFIAKLLEHDGKPTPRWDTEPPKIPPGLVSLMSLARWMYHPTRGTEIAFNEERLPNFRRFRDHWPEGKTMPLLVSMGEGTYRFLNEEVFGFLVAAEDEIAGYAEKCNWRTAKSIFQPGLVGITNRHYIAWLERMRAQLKGATV
jgi:hypothetical protein